jgi:hypothetical protein
MCFRGTNEVDKNLPLSCTIDGSQETAKSYEEGKEKSCTTWDTFEWYRPQK